MIIPMSRRVELIGHRGDPLHAPENTLVSFESAIDKGARGVEADVRRTADGVWVAFHDRSLRRTTGEKGWLSRKRWKQIQHLPIPAVSDLLSLCRKRGVTLHLDLKISEGEKQLLAVLRSSGWLHRTVICASLLASLKRWRKILPQQQPLFWVTGYRMPVTPGRIALAKSLKLTGLLSYKRWVTPRSVERVHKAGMKLYLWTARTPKELRRFASYEVDGIMSELWPPPSIS